MYFEQCRAKFRKYFNSVGGEFSFKGPSRFPNHTWMKGGGGRGKGGGGKDGKGGGRGGGTSAQSSFISRYLQYCSRTSIYVGPESIE